MVYVQNTKSKVQSNRFLRMSTKLLIIHWKMMSMTHTGQRFEGSSSLFPGKENAKWILMNVQRVQTTLSYSRLFCVLEHPTTSGRWCLWDSLWSSQRIASPFCFQGDLSLILTLAPVHQPLWSSQQPSEVPGLALEQEGVPLYPRPATWVRRVLRKKN